MKRPVKKVKRFDGEEGSQVFSEAQEKWLGGADRTDPYILARMRKAVPDEPKAEPKVETKPTVIESSEETGNKGVATETPKVAAPKPATKPAPKLAPKPVVKAETKEKAEPKVNGKTFSETISSSKSKDQEDKKLSAAEIAKIQREGISGKKDTKQKMPEPKSAGKKFREFFGSKYKEGGTVKRSSASNRGDGCATKGHTRGKIC
jgi:hypothetical protein